MKIKTVCELTGLTDRAVRYYTEEQLISPAYTENYLGRKSFDFTESDVQQLKDISVLRKFGFSIAEIKEMYSNPDQIFPIVKNLQQRKQDVIEEETTRLTALLRLDENRRYSLSELAECLSAPVVNEPVPAEDSKLKIGKLIVRKLKYLLLAIATWMPVMLAIAGIIRSINDNAYPVFSQKAFIFLLIALFPSFGMMFLPKLKFQIPRKNIYRNILGILCILSIPFCFLFGTLISSRSETSDIRNYRRFDSDCYANRDSFFIALFPDSPHYSIGNEKQSDGSWSTVYRNAHYLYRKLPAMDYTYDIYAEWRLGKEAFQKEVSRVKMLYDIRATNYVTIEKENYVCFIYYFGDPPFERVTDSYTYYIFAYDEEKQTVRYIWCDSLENGADQPYYLSLDW
mgnify:CR=1 FL=1